MIYRNDELAAESRILALRSEIAALGGDPRVAAARSLREQIRRERDRARRAVRARERLCRDRLGLAPRSLTELVVACALSFSALTLALGVVFVALCVATFV